MPLYFGAAKPSGVMDIGEYQYFACWHKVRSVLQVDLRTVLATGDRPSPVPFDRLNRITPMEHQSHHAQQQDPLPVANEKGNPAISAKGSRNESFGALREKGSEEMILLEFSQDLTLVADAHELEALIVKTLRAMESFQGFSISKIL